MSYTAEQLDQMRTSAELAKKIHYVSISETNHREEQKTQFVNTAREKVRQDVVALEAKRYAGALSTGDPDHKVSLEQLVKESNREILEAPNFDGSPRTEEEKNQMVQDLLLPKYDEVAKSLVDSRLRAEDDLLQRYRGAILPEDYNFIAGIIKENAKEALTDPSSLGVVLEEGGKRYVFDNDKQWAEGWVGIKAPDDSHTPEGRRKLQLRLDMLNRVADRIGGMKIFGKPAAEFVFGKVVGGGTRMAARTILSWAGVAGLVGGGVAGTAVAGAGVGAASGFAVEYFRQLMEFRSEVKAEWKRTKEENEARRARGEAELALRKVSLKEKLFTVKEGKKGWIRLGKAAAKGAAMGAVGWALLPGVSAFLEEQNISWDFLRGVPGVKGVFEVAEGIQREARGIDYIVTGGRLGEVVDTVKDTGKIIDSPQTLEELKSEYAKIRAQLIDTENKLQAQTKRLGNLSDKLNDFASKGDDVKVYGEYFSPEETQTLARYSKAVAKSLGIEEPDVVGTAHGSIKGLTEALANPDQFFAQVGIEDSVVVEVGSNPWNETEEMMTKAIKELGIPKPSQDEWNEMIRQANRQLCADNGYSAGAGLPGKDARLIQIGTKLNVTKEFKDFTLNLVKKAA